MLVGWDQGQRERRQPSNPLARRRTPRQTAPLRRVPCPSHDATSVAITAVRLVAVCAKRTATSSRSTPSGHPSCTWELQPGPQRLRSRARPCQQGSIRDERSFVRPVRAHTQGREPCLLVVDSFVLLHRAEGLREARGPTA